MRFRAEVKVTLKDGVLDPQGVATRGGLHGIGLTAFTAVRVGRLVELWLDAADEQEARRLVQEAGERLLANPVLESFTFTLAAVPEGVQA